MEALSASEIFLFEGFRFDRRGLFRQDENGALGPVEIGSRALDVLRVLLVRPGDLLSRDEIMASAWPGTVVEYNNLNVQISALRRVLDQDGAQGSCIQTVPGRGYWFVAPVKRVEPTAGPISPTPSGNGSDGSIAENEELRDRAAPGWKSITQLQPSRARRRLRGGIAAPIIGALVILVAIAVGIWHLPGSEAHTKPRVCQSSCCPLPT